MPNYGVLAALIPFLVGVLQLHVQRNDSLFETHPLNMWIFLVTTIIHYGVLAAEWKFKLQYQSHSQASNAIGFISGSLAFAALISVIPRSNGYIIFIAWAFVLVVYKKAKAIKDAFDWVYQKINGMEMEQQELPRLPV
ncbi:hypothetical protein Pint_32720 [Pistacia integerrima]|uniref:Uncharacterized protein n=1 Tax=Pistacia integerrima TaxID=434235 RepID=A0ACC0XR91_9ROSI|nr:hypothetical protein Pint_32720 [Pistacia integerrima]